MTGIFSIEPDYKAASVFYFILIIVFLFIFFTLGLAPDGWLVALFCIGGIIFSFLSLLGNIFQVVRFMKH